ncbi:MAG: hypothetical protein QOF51_2211 [Chloroflexota bacterium]|nr:hypothetical protein [Chloroflexota bacterium]
MSGTHRELRAMPTLREIRKVHYYAELNGDPGFRRALTALFDALAALQPVDRSAHEWLMRPDFDWSQPERAVEWARDSASKAGMAASMRLLQALAADPDEESPRVRHAMRLIHDAEAQEQAAVAALRIVAFCAAWPLPPDAAGDLAYAFTIEPSEATLQPAPGALPTSVIPDDLHLERGASLLARWALHGTSWPELAESVQTPPESVKYQVLDWAQDLGVHPMDAAGGARD